MQQDSQITDDGPVDVAATGTTDLGVWIGRTCACGCGRKVARRSKLLRGHYQRMRGRLMAAHQAGRTVAFLDTAGQQVEASVREYAARVLTIDGMASLEKSLARVEVEAPTTAEPGFLARVVVDGHAHNALVCSVAEGVPVTVVVVGADGPTVTERFALVLFDR
jgi:hypothetical protein